MRMPYRTLFAPIALMALTGLAGCGWMGNSNTSPAIAPPPARLALVIGNADYESVPPLRNPGNDADDVCAALRSMGYQTLCHHNLRDRAEFGARVGEYVALLGPATVGVVYYSGHGVQAAGANFLIPTQAQVRSIADDPTRVLFGLQDLFERLREKRARLQVVVLDACRTDLFAARPVATRSLLVRSLESTARASSGLLPINDAPPATAVLFATGAGDAAYDGKGRNGPMTQVLLRHLRTRGQKLNDLLGEVTRGVQAETAGYGRPMTPFIYGSYDGTLCLGGCVVPFEDPPR